MRLFFFFFLVPLLLIMPAVSGSNATADAAAATVKLLSELVEDMYTGRMENHVEEEQKNLVYASFDEQVEALEKFNRTVVDGMVLMNKAVELRTTALEQLTELTDEESGLLDRERELLFEINETDTTIGVLRWNETTLEKYIADYDGIFNASAEHLLVKNEELQKLGEKAKWPIDKNIRLEEKLGSLNRSLISLNIVRKELEEEQKNFDGRPHGEKFSDESKKLEEDIKKRQDENNKAIKDHEAVLKAAERFVADQKGHDGLPAVYVKKNTTLENVTETLNATRSKMQGLLERLMEVQEKLNWTVKQHAAIPKAISDLMKELREYRSNVKRAKDAATAAVEQTQHLDQIRIETHPAFIVGSYAMVALNILLCTILSFIHTRANRIESHVTHYPLMQEEFEELARAKLKILYEAEVKRAQMKEKEEAKKKNKKDKSKNKKKLETVDPRQATLEKPVKNSPWGDERDPGLTYAEMDEPLNHAHPMPTVIMSRIPKNQKFTTTMKPTWAPVALRFKRKSYNTVDIQYEMVKNRRYRTKTPILHMITHISHVKTAPAKEVNQQIASGLQRAAQLCSGFRDVKNQAFDLSDHVRIQSESETDIIKFLAPFYSGIYSTFEEYEKPDLMKKHTIVLDFLAVVKYALEKMPDNLPIMPLDTWVLGDLHGAEHDLDSFLRIMTKGDNREIFNRNILCCGDLVDRGELEIRTAIKMLGLIILSKKKVVILRGNHETRQVNAQYNFMDTCQKAFGPIEGNLVYEQFNDVFDLLPLAGLIGDKIFCVHGGISTQLNSREDILNLPRPLKQTNDVLLAQDLLWSDLVTDLDGKRLRKSSRNISINYGEEYLKKKLSKLGCTMMIRGHQVCTKGFVRLGDHYAVVFSSSGTLEGRPASMFYVDQDYKIHVIVITAYAAPEEPKTRIEVTLEGQPERPLTEAEIKKNDKIAQDERLRALEVRRRRAAEQGKSVEDEKEEEEPAPTGAGAKSKMKEENSSCDTEIDDEYMENDQQLRNCISNNNEAAPVVAKAAAGASTASS